MIGYGGYPKDPQVNLLWAIPGLITVGCLTFRLTEILIGLMYVLNTATNILFRDCSQFALTRPLKRQVCQMVE